MLQFHYLMNRHQRTVQLATRDTSANAGFRTSAQRSKGYIIVIMAVIFNSPTWRKSRNGQLKTVATTVGKGDGHCELRATTGRY